MSLARRQGVVPVVAVAAAMLLGWLPQVWAQANARPAPAEQIPGNTTPTNQPISPSAPAEPSPGGAIPANLPVDAFAPAGPNVSGVLPPANQPLSISSMGDLPQGITVNRDGAVFIGFRSVRPTYDKTNQFRQVDNGPRRYIFGRHIYVTSRDLLHGGPPVIDEWENYSLGDVDPPPADGSTPSGTVFMIHQQGTVAGVTNLPVASDRTTWVSSGMKVRAVPNAEAQAIATAISTSISDPQRYIPPPIPGPGFVRPATWGGPGWGMGPGWMAAHTAYYHRYYMHPAGFYRPFGYGAAVGYPQYSFPDTCLALVSEDAVLASVVVDYSGHSTPLEVIADLEGARDTISQADFSGDDSAVQQQLLKVYDAEIRTWQVAIECSQAAAAVDKAYAANEFDNVNELFQRYASQVAPYRKTPQYDLFARDYERLQELAERAAIAKAQAAKPAAGG